MKTINLIISFLHKYFIEQIWDTLRKALIISAIPLVIKVIDSITIGLNPSSITPETVGSLYNAIMGIHSAVTWAWDIIGGLDILVFILTLIPIAMREIISTTR